MKQKIKYKMNDINKSKYTPKKFDVLITNLSDEEIRSFALMQKLTDNQVLVENIIVLDYCNKSDAILAKLKIHHTDMFKNIEIISTTKENEESVLQVKEILDKQLNLGIIGIDISCIPVPQFFLLLKIIACYNAEIYVYYTEPIRYIMNEGIFESYFSTKGPITTKQITGFSGITVNNENNSVDRTLFCMLGFDNDLLPTVIQEAAPLKIVTINGFPSFYPKFKDISLTNNEKVLNGSNFVNKLEKSNRQTNYVYVEANNPFDAYNTLEELKQNYKNNCIDIVPLGTKPMALGACLYAINNNDVRVVFPFPEEYANTTSEESKNTWEYIINTQL